MDKIMTDISIRIAVLENLISSDEERLNFYIEKRSALSIQDGEIVAMPLDATIEGVRGLMKGRKAELKTLKALLTNLHDVVSAQMKEGDEE